jgi:hypothetical protein
VAKAKNERTWCDVGRVKTNFGGGGGGGGTLVFGPINIDPCFSEQFILKIFFLANILI